MNKSRKVEALMERLSKPAAQWTLLAVAVALLGYGLIGLAQQMSPSMRLAAAEDRWAARPFSHYRLVIEAGASCDLDVEVRDEQAINILRQSRCGYPARTVKDLFDLIKRNRPIIQECTYFKCVCRQSINVYAIYDEQWGYPIRVAVWLQRESNLQHPDYWRYVWEFQKLPNCARTSDAEIVRVVSLMPLP